MHRLSRTGKLFKVYMPMQYTAISKTVKSDNFRMTKCDIFVFFSQNIDCGNTFEYLQFMLLSKNKKIMYNPVNPSFTI